MRKPKAGTGHEWPEITDAQVQTFFRKAQKYLMYGVPGKDPQGHSSNFHFRVSQAYDYLTEEVAALAPKGWYKNKSELYRALMTLGCFVALTIFKRNTQDGHQELDSIREQMEKMVKLAKRAKIEEIDMELARIEEGLVAPSRHDRETIKGIGQVFDDMLRQEFKKPDGTNQEQGWE